MPEKNRNISVKPIRNILAGFVLLSFSIPVISTYSLFKFRQFSIHETIRKAIEEVKSDTELVLLRIPLTTEQDAAVFERRHEMEFKFEGKMYDVVRLEKHQGSTWYWCILDEEETALEDGLHALNLERSDSSPDQTKNQEALHVFLNTLFLTVVNLDLTPSFHSTNFCSFYWKNIYFAPNRTPPSPPPQT